MLAAGIIEPAEESEWGSPVVVQEKKMKGDIKISVDPFPTPFTYEVLENVGGWEAYSFIDGFQGYHQIKIAPEDRSKTTFAT